MTYVVHGFGNAGSNFSRKAEIEQKNWRLLAASDSKAAVKSNELIPKELTEHKSKPGASFLTYKSDGVSQISYNELFSAEADILVLAALGEVITKENADNVKAKYILELANGPVTDEAAKILYKKGIVVIPDIVANAGGVVVSYLEWKQNLKNEKWSEEQVNDHMAHILKQAIKQCYNYAKLNNLPLKDAAFILAIKRLTEEG